MIPIPKIPTPTGLADYRPISLLSCFSKIIERMAERRISHHLESLNIIKPTQGGFRPLRSAEEQALSIIQAAHGSWGKGRDHLLITLDIRKAFDTVWREGLIWKVFNKANITGPLGLWLADYLTGRSMSCHHKGCSSPNLPMPNGVPQGAVLSPVLFILYVDDLTVSLPADSPVPQFADDAAISTSLPRRSSTARKAKIRNVQVVLNQISDWFSLWKLDLSPTKTSIRILHPTPKTTTHDIIFKIQGVTTKHSTSPSTRYLGIHIDSKLNFKDHVQKAVEKASSRLAILRSVSNSSWGADIPTKLQLYSSWIRPILEYGSLVLSTAPRSVLHLLDKCQKACLLVAVGAQKNVSLPALELVTSTDSLELRRYARWASLAAKLRRCPCTPLRDMWDTLCKAPIKRQATFPLTFGKNLRGCLRPSPLLLALSISNHLKINAQDANPTPLLLESSCPWSPDPSVVPLPDTEEAQPVRPILGSASDRSPSQKAAALAYATARCSQAVLLGETILVTDGSACPLPSPLGGGGVGVVLSQDGITPLATHGAQAGVLVTNISTEISALALAVNIIDGLTSHLPETHPAPSARAERLAEKIIADRGSELLHLSTQAPPPPRFTILSDCQYAVDSCCNHVPAAHIYRVEVRKTQAAIYKIRRRGVRVTVDWIPGHCGHPLGDLADSIAKSHSTDPALPSLPSTATSTPLQVARDFIKARIRAWLLPTWWQALHKLHPQRLFAFQPDAQSPPPILKHMSAAKNRTQVTIYRLLLGQANNNNNMFLCGMRASSACSLCPAPKDSAQHRILHCPAYSTQRLTYVLHLRRMGLTLSIPVAIGLLNVPSHHHHAVATGLITFLESTNLTLLFVWDKETQEDPVTTSPLLHPPHPVSASNAPKHNPVPTHNLATAATRQTLMTQFIQTNQSTQQSANNVLSQQSPIVSLPPPSAPANNNTSNPIIPSNITH